MTLPERSTQYDDLIARLRRQPSDQRGLLCKEAADAIEHLVQELHDEKLSHWYTGTGEDA